MNALDLGEFISSNIGQFAPLELETGDGLASALAQKHDIALEDMAVVVDLDDSDPLAKVESGKVFGRMNGRFPMPKFTQTGAPVELTQQDWIASTKEWFQEQEIQYAFEEEEEHQGSIVKFTAFVPILQFEEFSPEPVEEPAPAEEPAKEEAPAKEAPEAEEASEESPEDKEKAEDLEKALNE
jgi:hypothetical protein